MSNVAARMWITRDGEELEVEVRGTYRPGSPAIGPRYDHGGIPGDPPEVDDIVAEYVMLGHLTGRMAELTHEEDVRAYTLLVARGEVES